MSAKRALCNFWLWVEAVLAQTGYLNLVNLLQVPEDIQQWMINKNKLFDGHHPGSKFSKIWTKFVAGISLSKKGKCNILKEMWCRPGRTRVIIFLLAIFWQAEYCGSRKDWLANTEHIDSLFNLILNHPDLYAFCIYFWIHWLIFNTLANVSGTNRQPMRSELTLQRSRRLSSHIHYHVLEPFIVFWITFFVPIQDLETFLIQRSQKTISLPMQKKSMCRYLTLWGCIIPSMQIYPSLNIICTIQLCFQYHYAVSLIYGESIHPLLLILMYSVLSSI